MLLRAGLVMAMAAPPAMALQRPPEADQAGRMRYTQLLQKKMLLERETQLKTLQLALAEEDAPYLLLDLEARKIFIYVRVSPVFSVDLQAAEMEEADRPEETAAPSWLDVQLDLLAKSGDSGLPEKIDPQAAGIPEGEAINPRSITPDVAGIEKPSHPSGYTLLFRQGVAVHISPRAAGEGTWVRERVERLASLLTQPELPEAASMAPVHTWIHLVMDEEQARHLYPALFVDMRAMVRLPGDPRL